MTLPDLGVLLVRLGQLHDSGLLSWRGLWGGG